MTNPISLEVKTHPTLALAAYLETLVRGRRVAVVGDAMLTLPESLLDRGARLVHVYDPDPGRVAVATARRAADPSGSRAHRPTTGLLSDELGVRDGAFEGVVITDLTLFEDPGEVIRRAKRLVSETGWVVVCSPNPAVTRTLFPASPDGSRALGYYELYDTLSLVFPEVRMLGQAPFVGYAIVDFSEPEPDISIDTSALESAEVPEWYIIVASERRAHLEGHAIVGLPSTDL